MHTIRINDDLRIEIDRQSVQPVGVAAKPGDADPAIIIMPDEIRRVVAALTEAGVILADGVSRAGDG